VLKLLSFSRSAVIALVPLLVPLVFQQSAKAQTRLICYTGVSSIPSIRGEGYNEQVADVTLTCTGGIAPTLGSVIPQFNLTLFFDTSLTSRMLPLAGVSNSVSEPLLLIDEPGSGLPAPVANFGPAAGLSLCTTPLQVCVE
jgi:hypothetical protein